jgi:hypothetical protein
MAAEAQLTPLMMQYRRIKGELPKDALLLFRLGDFYEMFFEDAQTGAQILNLALTARNGVPMCGLPHHASNNRDAPSYDSASQSIIHSEEFPATSSGLRMAGQPCEAEAQCVGGPRPATSFWHFGFRVLALGLCQHLHKIM